MAAPRQDVTPGPEDTFVDTETLYHGFSEAEFRATSKSAMGRTLPLSPYVPKFANHRYSGSPTVILNGKVTPRDSVR